MSILPKYNKITLNKKEFKFSNSTKDGQQQTHNMTAKLLSLYNKQRTSWTELNCHQNLIHLPLPIYWFNISETFKLLNSDIYY